MKLHDYLKPLKKKAEKEAFAARCGTTFQQIQNVRYGCKPCGPLLAVAIERETARHVTRKELLPDTWHLYWPELRDSA